MTNGTISERRQQHCWTNSQKAELVKTLAVIIQGQNAYGKKHNLEDTLAYLTHKLQAKHTVEQVIYAIEKYTDDHDDIPTPADINKILNPEEPKITQSEFIEAQKWQERNQNWSEFTTAHDTIAAFRRQNEEKRDSFKIQNEEIAQIARNSVKRIGGKS